MSTRPILLSSAMIVAAVALAQVNPDTIVDSPMDYKRNEIIRAPIPAQFISGTAEIGGEKIPLRLQFTKQPQPQLGLDDGRSGGFFEPFAAAARAGDDAAAHRLYEELQKCRSSPKTRAELDTRVAKGRKALEQSGGFVAPAETQDLKGMALGIAFLQRLFERCEGVTPEMYATAIELVRASVVERGYDDNRLLYAAAIHATDPREAQAQAELLWQKGYLNALGMLGVNSLPHQIAAIAADIALSARGAEQLAVLEAKTSASEFQEATKQAARILRNPNCCRY